MGSKVDTIVIGGSAGGFTALRSILSQLPENLPAAVLICMHTPVSGSTRMVDLLSRYATMPMVQAQDEMELLPGRIIFAPPDRHMMIGGAHLHLRRGAHENNFRPAIDPLFRSAAVYRGPRAFGVILSGYLNDGAAGARAMIRTGGRVIAQSPDTAEAPDMPQATLDADPAVKAIPLDDLASAIAKIAGQPCLDPEPVPRDIGIELKIAGLEGATMANEEKLGELSPYNCPHCNGVLWRIEDGPLIRFRCHTGHAYTLESLDQSQDDALDQMLFSSLRAHKGRIQLLHYMAGRSKGDKARKTLLERASLVEEDANRLERIIKNRGTQ